MGQPRYLVSCEDRLYHAWQAMLLHYSCLTRVGVPVTVMVHEGDGSLTPEFALAGDFAAIERTGGRVLRAASYARRGRGAPYPPRNAQGTLLEAAALFDADDVIVLCDPDFVFTAAFPVPDALAAAEYTYLDYTEAAVRGAAGRLGVSEAALASYGDRLMCGPPYLVPVRQARAVAQAWLEAIDAFDEPRWWDNMHAFGLAVARLGLPLERPLLAECNWWPDEPASTPIIHYCYDNDAWSKRNYQHDGDAALVWRSGAGGGNGTVLGAVLGQLHEAAEFYRTK